ncbi:methyl-accepting chemotaxis protein [Sulfuritalea sp.]|uniref:methyl-accepting chemotaxis protein n=1 Tax=Sulfuritalea sp. TaxID=2480090 RepID=UPI001AC48E67|nr:methyl-accepting chemotaxis protein [Sulfuritalea sp.]MBN8475625.1 PAS domain-containing protein [Sulfuritalea sp.]
MRTNLPVTTNEVQLTDATLIVSKTDLKGRMTYINKDFLDISGFTEAELIGEPHNLVRHPDMPVEAFQDLWDTLKAGRPWTGYVKNRCKNGDYYWVLANAAPIVENGQVAGYISVRRKAAREAIEAHEAAYRLFREKRQGQLVIRFGKAVKPGGIRIQDWNIGMKLWAGMLAILVAGGGTLAGVLLGLPLVAWLAGMSTLALAALTVVGIERAIRQPIAEITDTFANIVRGNYSNVIDIARNDEIGKAMQGLQVLQTRMGFEVAETKRQADETLRVKIALDNVSTPVRIANPEGRVIYANRKLLETLRRIEPQLKAQNANFSVDGFVGSSIGTLYADPDAALKRLSALETTVQTEMDIGGRTYRVITNPVFTANNERLGSVGEWLDRTDEIAIEREISTIVDGASLGKLDCRIALSGKNGFFATLSEGINGMLEATEKSLKSTSEILSRVAHGDLTQTMEGDFSGIFGQLKDDTNTTIERLREVVGRIKDATEAINIASQEIAAGNSDLSSRTEEQASSLEETSSAMEELNATVRQNAENARQANDLAKTSNAGVVKGGRVVKEVVVTMGEIQASSKKISDIIGVIDSIAFQTNILALNAAVEAARAGEQGRGFAVVASEVRNLAQRSATAAKEIKTLIAESVDKVESGAKLVQEAGTTMDGVVASFQQVAGLVTEIASASKEQSSGIEQTTQAVGQMDEVTQQNAALVEEAAAAAESLEEQARGLVQTVSMFKLAEGASSSHRSTLPAPVLRDATPRQLPPASRPAQRPSAGRKTPPPHLADSTEQWEEF